MFDREKFVSDRITKQKMSEQDIAEFDTFMALKTISMNPKMFPYVLALNTIQFTKLSDKVQAKVMEGFNGVQLTDKWFRADSRSIANRDEFHKRVMALFNTDGNTAAFMIRNDEVDAKLVNELYDYKFNGIAPKSKVSRKAKV